MLWLNKEVKLGSGTEEEGEVELDGRGRCGVGHRGRERVIWKGKDKETNTKREK